MNKFVVSQEESNQRLDKYLSSKLENFSRTFISKAIDEGNILLNDKPTKGSTKVKECDVIIFNAIVEKEIDITPEDIPLDIVYEDDDILIINKEQGMVVHPAAGHHEHTLVNAILSHCQNSLSNVNGEIRPGIVHRIDKDTSGLICVAKNDAAHLFLAEQLKDHTMSRTYVAIVKGIIKENSGEINLPIGRDPHNRKKMAVTSTNSKEAITYFKVLSRFTNHTLVECHLKTGRTHQIRVHFAYISHPVEGDPLYSGKHFDELYDKGQLLVAVKLKLIHPRTKKEMEFSIDYPQYFKNIISKL